MPALVIRCAVVDFDVWQLVFAEHAAMLRAHGSRGSRIFRGADSLNDIVVLLEWDDRDRARLFADSDDVRDALDRAGVIGQSDIWVLADGDRVPV